MFECLAQAVPAVDPLLELLKSQGLLSFLAAYLGIKEYRGWRAGRNGKCAKPATPATPATPPSEYLCAQHAVRLEAVEKAVTEVKEQTAALAKTTHDGLIGVAGALGELKGELKGTRTKA